MDPIDGLVWPVRVTLGGSTPLPPGSVHDGRDSQTPSWRNTISAIEQAPDLIEPDHVAVIRHSSHCATQGLQDLLVKVADEVLDLVALSLPLARPGSRGVSVRSGLVSCLWLQYASQRVSRTARHAAERMARRAGPWLSTALQSRRPSQGKRGTGARSVSIPIARCGVCCIGSHGGNCYVWI